MTHLSHLSSGISKTSSYIDCHRLKRFSFAAVVAVRSIKYILIFTMCTLLSQPVIETKTFLKNHDKNEKLRKITSLRSIIYITSCKFSLFFTFFIHIKGWKIYLFPLSLHLFCVNLLLKL